MIAWLWAGAAFATSVMIAVAGPMIWLPLGWIPWQIASVGAAVTVMLLPQSLSSLRLFGAIALAIGAGNSTSNLIAQLVATWVALPAHPNMTIAEFLTPNVTGFFSAYCARLGDYPVWTSLIVGSGAVCLIALIWGWAELVTQPLSDWRRRQKVKAIRARPGWLSPADIKSLGQGQGIPLGLYGSCA
ncbi:MAG: hypothetical protein WCJ64_08840 [Rhodospirillaceae bacterium]